MVVLPAAALSNAFCTIPSDCVSKALVASSRSRMGGFETIALAIAIRCFCPPESKKPLSPTGVSYPCGNNVTKPSAFALMHASLTAAIFSSPLAFSNGVPVSPISTFSRIDMENRTGSCETSPICDRSHLTLRSLMSVWSNSMAPLEGS